MTWRERRKPISVKINAEAYIRQMASAEEQATIMVAYAREIGCNVFEDSVETTPEQAAKLDAKWKEITGG